MAGILGDLFGLGGGTQAPTPGLLDAAGYMDPAQYDRMRQSQSMMGLWAGLLAGGGPSLSPRNFGSALGAGLTGAQQFGSQFDESQLHGAQAAQARANALKLADEVKSGQLGRQIAAEEIARNRGGGTAAAPGTGSSTPNFGAGSGGGGSDPRGVEPYIRAEAARLNIDPDIAVRVARSEGLGTFLGDGGKSGGAFQLYTGGGVGNMFERDTGLSPLDPANEKATITYALQHAAKNGWGAWNGAKKIGITGFTGIGERGAAPATTTELSAVPDFAGMFSGNQGASYAPAGPAAAPVPTVLTPPGTNPNAPPAPGAGAALGTGRTVLPPGRGLITPQDYADWQASGRVPSGPVNVGPSAGPPGGAAAPSSEIGGGLRYEPGGYGWRPPVPVTGNGPVNVRQLAGDAVPAEAGPSFGYGSAGGAISPAVLAAAAGGAPPVPSALVAPAPPVPAPAPPGAMPPAAAPPPAATVPPGAAGDLYPGLPAIPAPGALPTPMAPPAPVSRTGGPVAVPALPGPAAGTTTSGLTPAQLQQSRSAQNLELAFGLMKIPVPDYLKERAKLEAGGQLAAAQEAATQPYKFQMKLFEDALQNRRDQYNAMDKTQQEQYAASLGMQRDQVSSGFKIIEDRIKQQTEAALAGPTAGAQEQARMDVQARTSPGIKYNEELLAGAGKQDVALRGKADAAREALIVMDDTREQLRGSGIFSGATGNTKLALAKLAAEAGWPNEKIANTETYLMQAGKQAVALLSSGAYGSGSGISENDRRAAERLAGGDLTLDIETIKRILDISERAGHRAIETFNSRIASHPDAARLSIPVPPRLVGTTGDGKRVYQFPDGSRQVRD